MTYIERERDREGEIHIYIYIHIMPITTDGDEALEVNGAIVIYIYIYIYICVCHRPDLYILCRRHVLYVSFIGHTYIIIIDIYNTLYYDYIRYSIMRILL